jgi:tRNA dimethylallyltransferase
MKFDAVLIAGPTASGKSAAALALAEAVNGVIINADSMQVYAEAQILTARPDAAALARVPHALYGHVSVREAYSVGRYAADARAVLADVLAQKRLPIFVGGTGLYFTALTDGLSDIPPTPPPIRDQARAMLDKIGAPALHEKLKSLDPVTAARLKPGDPQRNLRAYEVFLATGRPLAQWQDHNAPPVLEGMRLARLVADPPRPQLRAAIAQRFEAMVEQGGVAEALALRDLDPALPAAKLLGRRELIALGEGRMTREVALDAAITATRQFAKRQMTWFRGRMADYVWFDPYQSNIITTIEHFSV